MCLKVIKQFSVSKTKADLFILNIKSFATAIHTIQLIKGYGSYLATLSSLNPHAV